MQVCGREHARGLFAPPAALQGDTIVLRRESLARWLWERFEAFSLKRADGPFKAVAEAYGLERDFDAALPRLLDEQGESLILHELGEHRAGQGWSPAGRRCGWRCTSRRTELHVGAVRDHLADLELTLPTLLERGAAHGDPLLVRHLRGRARALFPSLPRAYAAWRAGDAGRRCSGPRRAGPQPFSSGWRSRCWPCTSAAGASGPARPSSAC